MEEGEPEELVAVLQKRGEFNHEKMGPESWPGACQITVHGSLEEHESWSGAMFRESGEELGTAVWNCFNGKLDSMAKLLSEKTSSEKEVRTFGIELPAGFLKRVRLNASTGGLHLLRKKQVSQICRLCPEHFSKAVGVDERLTIAMFPDEIEAVKKAFEIFDPETLIGPRHGSAGRV